MTYVKTTVLRPSAIMPGNGGDVKDKVNIFDWEDVTGGYSRNASGIEITGPLVFKDGAYAIQIYATQDGIKVSSESQGDTDAEGFIQSVEFPHPGNLKAIREFAANWLGKSIGIIIEKCSDGTMTLYGSPCAPLRLAAKSDWDKDKNNKTLTFKSAQKGPDVADYLGTITYADVMGTVAADATTVNVAAGAGEYQLTDGTVAAVGITNLTSPVNGSVYTLLGSGGTYPSTIAAGGNFLLANGTGWTATSGGKITFQAFKDGASTYSFVELSRL